jgi:hypothetical protein
VTQHQSTALLVAVREDGSGSPEVVLAQVPSEAMEAAVASASGAVTIMTGTEGEGRVHPALASFVAWQLATRRPRESHRQVLLERAKTFIDEHLADERLSPGAVARGIFVSKRYESGSEANPGPRKPADRIPAMAQFVRSRGYDLPLGVGEYNGYSAASIAAAGEALLSTPNIWFGCVWNSSGGKGLPLSGDRLDAFKQTLADARSAEPLPPT